MQYTGVLNSIAPSTTRLRIQRLLPQERPRIKPDCVQETNSFTLARTFLNEITAYSLYSVVSRHTGRDDATVAPPAFFGMGKSVPMRSICGRSHANDQIRVINTNVHCISTATMLDVLWCNVIVPWGSVRFQAVHTFIEILAREGIIFVARRELTTLHFMWRFITQLVMSTIMFSEVCHRREQIGCTGAILTF